MPDGMRAGASGGARAGPSDGGGVPGVAAVRVVSPRRTTVVVGLGVCAWAAFAVLTLIVVSRHGAPLPPDRALLARSLGHRPPMAVAAARALTDTGTGAVPYALVIAAGLIAGRTARQRCAAAVTGLLCLGLGQAVRYGVMDLVGRVRPPYADWEALASGWSYPSGHTTTSALTAGLLITALWLRAPHGRGPLTLLVACWGAGVGLTRIFLGVHWFTDVLGGWLFAAGWLALFLTAAARWLPADVRPGAPEPGSGEAP
ncbi:phosphatase PAP2 family protein [Streptomyces griseofuscus]|uniref:Phosphatase PAP2 family protein n=1 Tax=Streptomyces griseofuscus TaxID=146922 RepID=A0A7H1PSB8_9ACTN|nr:phosphatase PAP2 family protein [Streptomyces griseofuscus]QNT90948.1 phosphatase PAP2 family protein [Streptomyces griseofuscus]BBC91803.1 PAP2 family protein [Streptomyces rochei]